MRSYLVALLVTFCAAELSAACPQHGDLEAGYAVRMSRDAPRFEATYSRDAQGELVEDRVTVRDGRDVRVRSTYATPLSIKKREPLHGGAVLAFRYLSAPDGLNNAGVGARALANVVLEQDGVDVGRGSEENHITGASSAQIGDCEISFVVVRSSLKLEGRAPINAEKYYAQDLGLVIGFVSMDARWQPRSGVFFDRIERVTK